MHHPEILPFTAMTVKGGEVTRWSNSTGSGPGRPALRSCEAYHASACAHLWRTTLSHHVVAPGVRAVAAPADSATVSEKPLDPTGDTFRKFVSSLVRSRLLRRLADHRHTYVADPQGDIGVSPDYDPDDHRS